MANIDLSKIKASSLLPGLQNVGTSSTTLTVNGTIPNQGNLIGTGTLLFPLNNIMALVRVNFPDAHGDLASSWFPVIGTIQVYDATSKWYLTLYTQPNPNGRSITFDFTSNDAVNNIALTNFRILLAAHLYTYPWGN